MTAREGPRVETAAAGAGSGMSEAGSRRRLLVTGLLSLALAALGLGAVVVGLGPPREIWLVERSGRVDLEFDVRADPAGAGISREWGPFVPDGRAGSVHLHRVEPAETGLFARLWDAVPRLVGHPECWEYRGAGPRVSRHGQSWRRYVRTTTWP